MPKLYSLVEGPGDIEAVPVLLRRLLQEKHQRYDWQPVKPWKVNSLQALRNRLSDFAERLRIERDCDGVLVLLDLDDGCPVKEATALAHALATFQLPFPIVVVLAHREYEAWFLASLPSIAPKNSLFPDSLEYPTTQQPEDRRGAKEWLTSNMPRGRKYEEVLHQQEFTRHLDFTLATNRSRSFQRLEHAIDQLLTQAGQRGYSSP